MGVDGEDDNPPDAAASWNSECERVIDEQVPRFGGRLLGAACPKPKNVSPFPFKARFRGHLIVRLAPIDAPHYTVEGFIKGEFGASGREHTNYLKACTTWFEKQADIVGVQRIESLACGDPDPALTPSGGDLMGRPRIEVADVRVKTTHDVVCGTVTGPPDPINDGFRDWITECDAEIARQQDTLGERFLAASCPEARNIAPPNFPPRYESDLEVHVLP